MKSRTALLIVFIVVLLSRFPFLNAGYGSDSDAWRVACAARWIATMGEYIASRLPGYPIPELIYSMLDGKEAWVWNAVTAILSAIGAGMLALIGKYYGCKNYLALAIAYAFTPVVFINSSTSMDYIWAASFILIAWHAGITSKVWLAGFLLGMAAGCRITSLIMLLPMILMLKGEQKWRARFQEILIFCSVTIVITMLAFYPVFRKYGFHFLNFYQLDYPPFILFAKRVLIDVWGVIGAVALIYLAIIFFLKRKWNDYNIIFPTDSSRFAAIAWMLVVVLYTILFLRLPTDAGYLIPIIPFLYLFVSIYSQRRIFQQFTILIIASAFFIGIDSADRPWSSRPSSVSSVMNFSDRNILIDWIHGPVLIEHERRLQHIKYIEHIIAFGDTVSEKCVIVSGVWYPHLIFALSNGIPENESENVLKHGKVDYVDLLSLDQIYRYQQQKIKIYYVTSAEKYNYNASGLDITRYGAGELKVE